MAALGNYTSFLGLDLGSYAVKAVEVKRRRGALFVSGYAYEPVMDPNNYPAAIRAAVKSGGLKGECVSIAVSGKGTLVDAFDLAPAVNIEEEIAKRISKVIAEAGDDLLYDCDVREGDGGSAQKAVLVAARKSELEPRLAVLDEAGLRPAVVDSELVAMVNAYETANAGGLFAPVGQAVGLVNFGATKTLMAYTDGERSLFREYPVGGNSLTEQLACRLSVGLDEAESLKCRLGDDMDTIKDVIHSGLEEVAAEIRRAADTFVKKGGTRPDLMVLSGGLAGFPGAVAVLSRLLRAEVKVFDTFGAVEADMYDAKFLHQYAHEFPLAFGLACRLAS